MQPRYQPAFTSLTDDQSLHLTKAIVSHHPDLQGTPNKTGLYDFCRHNSLDQADVVLSLSRDTSSTGISTIETIVGHPITRRRPANVKKKAASRGAARSRTDNRIILTIVPNPKRPGTRCHGEYDHYRVGQTVTEYLEASGGTQANIRYDTARNFITLGDPKS